VSDHQQRAIEWQRGRIDSLERLLAATKASHDEMAKRLQGAYRRHIDEVEAHRMTRGLLEELRGLLRTAEAREKSLREFVGEDALEPCEYGDNCPVFGGTRHYTCRTCKARRELEWVANIGAPAAASQG
jgi:hypothetical protein